MVIGGNGSQTGTASLAKEGFAAVGVPSTIDNDLYGTDISIGADTAINVTLEAIDRLRTTASSHQRAFVVETMGRDCGYIALMAGIAGGAEVIAHSRARSRARRDRRAPARRLPPRQDARAGGDGRRREARRGRHCSSTMASRSDTIGFDLRVTRLGHVVRGGVPSAADRVLATRLGAAAVDSLAAGRHGVLVGMLQGKVGATSLAEIGGRTRPADAALLELARTMAL